ncbi:MAG TPA: rhomboid family intramembrane serine protease, partial [Gemmatimonadaceae bacterium]|nr:rhomboid family intramembrane serine protease [Gemmatimonadaceae bacterium]
MTPIVRILLFANIGVFFLQSTTVWITELMIFIPRLIVVRPWTVITYMFLHGGMMHLVFNMLGLFFFGPRVEERLGSRSFVYLYLISGITGALLSLIMGPSAAVLGASA